MTLTLKIVSNQVGIPVYYGRLMGIETKPIKGLDERICCRYARQSDEPPASCQNLVNGQGVRPWCRLNGPDTRSLCVFDEPDEAPVWARILEQRRLAAMMEVDDDHAASA